MLRTENSDLLSHEEYVPLHETLISYGHVVLRVHLSKVIDTTVRKAAVEQLKFRRFGRKDDFSAPSIELPHRFTDKIVDALREPVANPDSRGVVGREALRSFLVSYDEATLGQ